jgi:hypothetical protein
LRIPSLEADISQAVLHPNQMMSQSVVSGQFP